MCNLFYGALLFQVFQVYKVATNGDGNNLASATLARAVNSPAGIINIVNLFRTLKEIFNKEKIPIFSISKNIEILNINQVEVEEILEESFIIRLGICHRRNSIIPKL